MFDGTISEFNKGEFKNKLAFPKRVLLDFNFSWFEIGEVIRVSACFSFLYLYVIYNKTRGQFAYYFDTMQGDKKELKFNDGSAMYPSWGYFLHESFFLTLVLYMTYCIKIAL